MNELCFTDSDGRSDRCVCTGHGETWQGSSCQPRLFAVVGCSPVVVGCDLDRRRVATVDVDLDGGSKIERFVLKVHLVPVEPLGGLGADQLLDRLELELVVVVLRRDELLECLSVGDVFDVLADRLDEEVRPVPVEEVGDCVQSVDEVLRGLEVNPPGIVAPAHSMRKVFAESYIDFGVCTALIYHCLRIDLLPRLKTRESRHGISGRAWPYGFKTHTSQASLAW